MGPWDLGDPDAHFIGLSIGSSGGGEGKRLGSNLVGLGRHVTLAACMETSKQEPKKERCIAVAAGNMEVGLGPMGECATWCAWPGWGVWRTCVDGGMHARACMSDALRWLGTSRSSWACPMAAKHVPCLLGTSSGGWTCLMAC
nr:hypothetical protein Iba_chr11bCG14180 [Ipomoea batatas]